MRTLTIICASVLVLTALFSVLPINNEAAVYNDMIRLHILAQDDSEEEQELKLKVRDEVLAKVDELIENANGKDEAFEIIESNLENISEVGRKVVVNNGYDHSVTAEIGREVYPEREYDNFTLPAGEYYSLRIKIGDAAGKNWWCVVFPPLCTASASESERTFISAGFTDEQYRVITETEGVKYKVKFKILEVLEDIVRKVKK